MNATPEGSKQTRRITYRDTLADVQPDNYAVFLVNSVIECGLYAHTASGVAPLGWQEIKAWQEMTGKIDPWLAISVRDLSLSYVNEFINAKDPARPSPLKQHLDQQENRNAVSAQFSNIFNKKFNR